MRAEVELLNYRSNPTNRNFKRVYDITRNWVYHVAKEKVRQYPNLSSDAVDDVANEGFLSMANAARRYVYFCRRCGEVFIYRKSFVEHCKDVHRIRGVRELVTIETFAATTSKLAMKRKAGRLLHSNEVLTEQPELGIDDHAEASMIIDVLIRQVGERLSEDGERLLLELIFSDKLKFDPDDRVMMKDLRRRVFAHIG